MKKYNIEIKVIKVILVIIWMITIYCFSAQEGADSSDTSQSFTMMLIQTVTNGNVEIETSTLNIIEGVIRKLAHYSIYTVGGFLIINYAYSTTTNNKKNIFYSILFGIGYAITDEIHQYFVPGRSARLFDVGIDALGVITGVLIYLAILKVIKLLKGEKKSEYKCNATRSY